MKPTTNFAELPRGFQEAFKELYGQKVIASWMKPFLSKEDLRGYE